MSFHIMDIYILSKNYHITFGITDIAVRKNEVRENKGIRCVTKAQMWVINLK